MTMSQIPSAFRGLQTPLASLKHQLLSPDRLRDSTDLGALDYKTSVILEMGDVSGGAGRGSWFCWCRSDDTEPWRWLWATRVGCEGPPAIYEDVKEMLDRYWKTYLEGVAASYDGDIGRDELL
jgi:hypothetical protein